MKIAYASVLLCGVTINASPLALNQRTTTPGKCLKLDPLIIAINLPLIKAPAKAYCSSLLLTSTTATITTVPTVTASASTTTTDTTITETSTVVASTETDTVGTATVTITNTIPANNPYKRSLPTPRPIVPCPAFLKIFATSKLSSACSCIISAPTQTISTTFTATAKTTTTTVVLHTTDTATVTESITTTTDVIAQVTATACAVATGNVLINGGFETGDLAPWYEGPSNSQDDGGVVSPGSSFSESSYSLVSNIRRIPGSLYSRRYLRQDVKLCTGQSYEVGFDYRFTNANGPDCYAYYFVKYPSDTEGTAVIIVGGPDNGGTNGDWQQTGGSFTATGDTATIQVLHLCANRERATLYFDNIKLEAVAAQSPPP